MGRCTAQAGRTIFTSVNAMDTSSTKSLHLRNSPSFLVRVDMDDAKPDSKTEGDLTPLLKYDSLTAVIKTSGQNVQTET